MTTEQDVKDAMDAAYRDAEEQRQHPHGVPFEGESTQQPAPDPGPWKGRRA